MKKLKTDWTKEELLGTKLKINSQDEWDVVVKACESVGIQKGEWHGCDYEGENTPVVMISWDKGCEDSCKLIATKKIYWYECSGTLEPFRGLEEISIENFYVEEESKQAQEGEVKYVPVKCGVWEIASLKDDFEVGLLYKKVDQIQDENILECVTDYDTLWEGLIGSNLHRKTVTNWYDKLNGTEENGVWCWVWDNDMEHPSNDFVVEYRSSTEGDHTYFVSNETVCWDYAKPMSQQAREEMLKIMKGNS